MDYWTGDFSSSHDGSLVAVVKDSADYRKEA